MTDATMTAEKQWAVLCFEQGWSDESKIVHLEGFLRNEGLLDKFVAYAQVAAAEESGDISADPRLAALEELGYDILEDSDQPGLWLWMAPTDAAESSVDSALMALDAAWADAAGQAMDILGLSAEDWATLSLEQQIEKVSAALAED